MNGPVSLKLLILLILLSICHPGIAQDDPPGGFSDDSLYIHARDLAFSGDYSGAKLKALVLIERNPDYYDAWVLVARIFAWEADYDSARYFISALIALDPGYYDALTAYMDIEYWGGNYAMAVEMADRALELFPEDELILVKKARALMLLGYEDEAAGIVDLILKINPGNEEAGELKRELGAPGFFYFRENNYLLAGYYGEFFDNPFSRHYHMGTVGYSHYNEWGPLTGRVNFANVFFDGTGYTRYPSLQYEADAYPRLDDRTYLFLNYAFSRGAVFPGHRAAAEIFRSLPAGFEASAGLRFLYWDKSYLFYTGSLGKYHGNMWFSFRPYIIPRDEGLSGSLYLTARRYYNSADDFAGVVAGYGLSPDTSVIPGDDRIFLKSTSIGLELSRSISGRFLARTSLKYEYEEFMDNSYRNRWSFNLGLRYYL